MMYSEETRVKFRKKKELRFGHDSVTLFTGFNHQPQDGSQCQVSRNDGEYYDDTHQKAVYYPGQQVVLAHPMKVRDVLINIIFECLVTRI